MVSTARRNRKSARWAVLIASGVVAAGFYVAILNSPQPMQTNLQPVQAGPQPASFVSPAPAQPEPVSDDGANAPASSGLSQPGTAQPPVFAPRPRLRSRGS